MSDIKTLSVRLPRELYARSAESARRRKKSLNAFLQEGLRRAVEAEEEQALKESFDRLGEDAELCNVEYAFAAQREVIMRDEY